MNIEALGSGCAKCTQLYDNVKKTLVIAGQVKFFGKLAPPEEIRGML